MKTVYYKKQKPEGISHNFDVRHLINSKNMQMHHWEFKPVERTEPCIAESDEFYYILEGNLDIRIGTQICNFDRDLLVESPGNAVHQLMNNSETFARVLVFRAVIQNYS